MDTVVNNYQNHILNKKQSISINNEKKKVIYKKN